MSTRSSRAFVISLPRDMSRMVERKVASGQYASVDEVVRDGLRALRHREEAVAQWLRDDVVPAYDAHFAAPSQGLEMEEVFDRLVAPRPRKRAAGAR